MAAVPDNFDKTKTLWNAGLVYVDITPPAAGAVVTLDASGKPDATENPNARHVGFSDKGSKFSYKMTKADATDDEHTAPHDSRITTESMMISGTWKQILDEVLLAKISVGGQSATLTTPAGKKVSFGGKQAITGLCILIVTPKKDDPTKFIQICGYSMFNDAGVEVTVTKDAENSTPFNFVGLALTARAVNDQLGFLFVPS